MKKAMTFAITILFFANIAAAIQWVSFDRGFFESFYRSNETAQSLGMSLEDLMIATDHLLDYLAGDQTDLDVIVMIDQQPTMMYNQREIDHMIDVLDLFNLMVLIRNIGYGLFLLIMVVCYIKDSQKFKTSLFHASMRSLMYIGITVGVVILLAIVDFNWFWTVFHEILFDNDLWLLDPRTDRLVVMVPLAFFQRMIATILFAWSMSVLLWLLIAKVVTKRSLA